MRTSTTALRGHVRYRPGWGGAVVVLLLLAVTTACGSGAREDAGAGSAAPERISVLASTPVWRDIAAAVGGGSVETRSVIPAGVDPHEFQAAPGDALAIEDADIIVSNGGGYDGFVATMVQNTGGDARVVEAYRLHAGAEAGADQHDHSHDHDHDHGHGHGHGHEDGQGNEHVWFDLETVGVVADSLAEELADIDAGDADGYRSRAAEFQRRLAELGQAADAMEAMRPAPVLSTEPVAHYLLERAGIDDLTPPAFGEAMEHGSDPAPADVAGMRRLLTTGGAAALVYNPQADGPAAQTVRDDAERSGVPVVEVAETPPEGVGYVEWVERILTDLRAAVL